MQSDVEAAGDGGGKKTKNQTRTRHKEPLRRWLTSRPVSFLSFRVRAKARALAFSPQDSASKSSSSSRASGESAGREDTKARIERAVAGWSGSVLSLGLIYLPELIVP